jgi:hypothetical protein
VTGRGAAGSTGAGGRRAAGAAAAVAVIGAAAWLAAAGPAATPAWEARVPERLELAPGVAGVLAVELVPGPGRTVSRDGPVRIDVGLPDGVTTPRPRLALADAVDPGAAAPTFAVKLTAAAVGRYDVVIDVRLWLCARQSCKPVRAKHAVTVEVRAPAPVDAAPAPDAAPALPDARTRPRGPRRGR